MSRYGADFIMAETCAGDEEGWSHLCTEPRAELLKRQAYFFLLCLCHSVNIQLLHSPSFQPLIWPLFRRNSSRKKSFGGRNFEIVLATRPCLWREREKPVTTDLASFTKSAKSIFFPPIIHINIFKAIIFEFGECLTQNQYGSGAAIKY